MRLHLVDHNILNPAQRHLAPAVTEIIDHHADEEMQSPLLDPANKHLEPVGSATTLIADRYLNSDSIEVTPELATLLLGPILMDTANLSSAEKTTAHDVAVADALLALAPDIVATDYFHQLHEARLNVEGMPPKLLLKKDYKQYVEGPFAYGIASIPASVTWWHDDEQDLLPLLSKFTEAGKLDLLILGMSHYDGSHRRRLMVYAPTPELVTAIDHYFQTDGTLSRELVPSTAESDCGLVSYYETISDLSRKHLQPMFHFTGDPEIIEMIQHHHLSAR